MTTMEMTTFEELEKAFQEHVSKMFRSAGTLYETDINKDTFWKLYLESFPEGTNPIMDINTEHDCSSCRHFLKEFGGVVTIQDGKVTSIWDFDAPGRYGPVVKALAQYVHSKRINGVFVTNHPTIGHLSDFQQIPSGVVEWEHFHVDLPDRFVNTGRQTVGEIKSSITSAKDVFYRSLNEISRSSIESVLELISSNSLYRGEEWKLVLERFLDLQKKFDKLANDTDENVFCWENSIKAGPAISKIKNHSIGVLLVDITTGMDLDEAVRRYEKIVAPSNYKRPKSIFGKMAVEAAEKTITELGYLGSLTRRYATINDITINDILFADRSIKKLSVFEELSNECIDPKRFNTVSEVSLSDFISNILPTCKKLEILVEGKHSGNFMSLIAPENRDAPGMFKWNNGFSWAYAGNIADSMKQRVKTAGGRVDGPLRFSIQWGPENNNDFDAHCIEPTGNEIYFASRYSRVHASSGMLDVDIRQPKKQTQDGIAVENITWSDINRMPAGTYEMFVHNYSHDGGRTGFTAEVEFEGQVHSFACNRELRQDEKVPVAAVKFSKQSGFSIVGKLPAEVMSQKIWNIDTNQFKSVSIVMYSPNFWDGQAGIGNKHVFFMLGGCQNSENPNGFFNEYLKEDLLKHRKVFEALGSKMKVADSEEQLSGLGFSTTQHNVLIVRVTNNVVRTLKVVI